MPNVLYMPRTIIHCKPRYKSNMSITINYSGLCGVNVLIGAILGVNVLIGALLEVNVEIGEC